MDKDKAILIGAGIFLGGCVVGNLLNRLDNKIKAWRDAELAKIVGRARVDEAKGTAAA